MKSPEIRYTHPIAARMLLKLCVIHPRHTFDLDHSWLSAKPRDTLATYWYWRKPAKAKEHLSYISRHPNSKQAKLGLEAEQIATRRTWVYAKGGKGNANRLFP